MSTVIQLKPSASEKPTVARGRDKNADYRSREYLTEAEVEKLLAAAARAETPSAIGCWCSWPSGTPCA